MQGYLFAIKNIFTSCCSWLAVPPPPCPSPHPGLILLNNPLIFFFFHLVLYQCSRVDKGHDTHLDCCLFTLQSFLLPGRCYNKFCTLIIIKGKAWDEIHGPLRSTAKVPLSLGQRLQRSLLITSNKALKIFLWTNKQTLGFFVCIQIQEIISNHTFWFVTNLP